MKILWLDINSSYSHSSVALPAIHAQVDGRDEWEWCVVRHEYACRVVPEEGTGRQCGEDQASGDLSGRV